MATSGLHTFLTLWVSNLSEEHPFAHEDPVKSALLFLIASIKRNLSGTRNWFRTSDLRIMKPVLSPTELFWHMYKADVLPHTRRPTMTFVPYGGNRTKLTAIIIPEHFFITALCPASPGRSGLAPKATSVIGLPLLLEGHQAYYTNIKGVSNRWWLQ